MTNERFTRMQALFGEEAMQKLSSARVLLFGVGGVGGYVAEALVRSGIGNIELVDNDTVSVSNINRQIIALTSTIGKNKTDVVRERLLDINPECNVAVRKTFFLPENAQEFDFTHYDYIVDAVDTVTAKIAIIEKAYFAGVPVISSMGTGNKCDPTRLTVSDIYQTKMDPLAKVLRAQLKKRRVKKCKVVYSEENPIIPLSPVQDAVKRAAPGSTAFVPPVAGFIIAGEIIKDLTSFSPQRKGC